MAAIDRRGVGRRIGQLAGALAFVLMIGRLGRLLLSGPDQPQWNLILVAVAFLGAVSWWLLGQISNRTAVKVGAFAVAGVFLGFRIISPSTLDAGIIPTGETFSILGDELGKAFQVLDSGVPPVAAEPGLLGILAIAMWAIGALYTYGATGGPFAAMFLPSLVMYFQFAVYDRLQAGLGWLMVSSLTLALSIVSMALERRGETGRARDGGGRPLPRRALGFAAATAAFLAVGAIAVADNASGLISEYGNAPWRSGSGGGYGDGEGGIQFGLVDLRARVINPSEEVVFFATLGPQAPPANEIYWRVETFDVFDGEEWDRLDRSPVRYEPGQPLANTWDVYQGSVYDFEQVVRIESLVTVVAPTAGVPVEIQQAGAEEARRPTDFQVLSDAAILANPGLRRGDVYELRTYLADQRSDFGVLATGDDGSLTPMFAAAAMDGAFPYEPGVATEPVATPPDLERYIELPANTPANIRNLARAQTFEAESNFEAAWILQSWFRETGEFTYSTELDTGHSALVLDDWLTDPTSQFFRTGYCEHFAAAMAVMARTLEIPSRVVWGFTPGDIELQEDGTERVAIRERNAHAWVEVWLDPYGWVQFDPTPRREQTGYDSQPASITAGLDPDDYEPDTANADAVTQPSVPNDFGSDPALLDDEPIPLTGSSPRWWLIGLVTLVPLAMAIPIYKRIRRRRRLARVREGDITAAWDEIVDRLDDLGHPLTSSMTPIEAARSTDPALMPLAVSYSSTVYGNRRGQARESDLLEAEWWIDRTYDSPERIKAAMSLRSILKGDS